MTDRGFVIDFEATPITRLPQDLGDLSDGVEYLRIETEQVPIDGVFKRVSGSDKLIIIFPAALPISEPIKRFPALFRWSWVEHINTNVWCFEEAIARKYDLLAGWFQYGERFHAEVIAEIVRDMADALGVALSDVTLIGSSLGGFGALMVGPELPGCLVIADIAQTDLYAYQYPSHIRALCAKVYGTEDISAVNGRYRDRFSVLERYKKLGRVPDIIMLHELTDEPNGEQQVYAFLAGLGKMRQHSSASFSVRSIIRCTGEGHRPLYQNLLFHLLQSERRI